MNKCVVNDNTGGITQSHFSINQNERNEKD